MPRDSSYFSYDIVDYASNTSTLTSPSEVGMATSRCVHISAVRTMHSGGVADPTRFRTASSKFRATSLMISESVNGSTSRPVSGPITFANVVSNPLRIIIFHILFCSAAFTAGFSLRMVRHHLEMGFGTLFSLSSVVSYK